MKIIRRLYDWVLSWSSSPYGALALFILAFAESSFFPIPPDILLIALVLGSRTKAFKYALNCSIASVCGAMLGYFIGYWAWYQSGSSAEVYSNFAQFFFAHIPGFTESSFERIRLLFEQWNFWVVFTAGFTPIPFKLITIAAGACKISFPMFIVGAIVSRSARFFIIAFLIWKFGEPIKKFIDKYFNLLSLVFMVLLIGGFILIKYAF